MKKVETLKKELYLKARAQASDRLGLEDQEIRKSHLAWKRTFSQDWQKTKALVLQKKIETSDLIFWGDFHGVQQFQRNLLRWLKAQPDTTHLVIA